MFCFLIAATSLVDSSNPFEIRSIHGGPNIQRQGRHSNNADCTMTIGRGGSKSMDSGWAMSSSARADLQPDF